MEFGLRDALQEHQWTPGRAVGLPRPASGVRASRHAALGEALLQRPDICRRRFRNLLEPRLPIAPGRPRRVLAAPGHCSPGHWPWERPAAAGATAAAPTAPESAATPAHGGVDGDTRSQNGDGLAQSSSASIASEAVDMALDTNHGVAGGDCGGAPLAATGNEAAAAVAR